MPENEIVDSCPRCLEPLIAGKMYCPNCGLAIVAVPERIAIDTYIEARANRILDGRLSDQSTLVREVADKAEDVVWARMKRYTLIVSAIIAALGAYGISSIHDAKTKIVDEARARLEPVIADTETRVAKAKAEIGQSEQEIRSVNAKLNTTSSLADGQTDRLTKQGGEISTKLTQVENENQRAALLSASFEKRANELTTQLDQMRGKAEQSSRQLDSLQKSFESRFAAVTKQLDEVNVRQAFPGLGKKLYVTYDNKPWKGKADKRNDDKWVNIVVGTDALPDISQEQMETFLQALRKQGLTPLPAAFGVAGPYQTGFGGFNSSTQVNYFDEKNHELAARVAKMLNDVLKRTDASTNFVDPTRQNAVIRQVIEESGLDLQVYFSAPPK